MKKNFTKIQEPRKILFNDSQPMIFGRMQGYSKSIKIQRLFFFSIHKTDVFTVGEKRRILLHGEPPTDTMVIVAATTRLWHCRLSLDCKVSV